MAKNINRDTEVKKEIFTSETPNINVDEVRKEVKKIIENAQNEAKKIIADAKKTSASSTADKTSGLTEAEKAEIARNEEYVEVKLFKDNDKYQDDVYVAVGNQNCMIKRGVPVKIKRKFYLALCQSDEQDLKTAQLIEKESENYREL